MSGRTKVAKSCLLEAACRPIRWGSMTWQTTAMNGSMTGFRKPGTERTRRLPTQRAPPREPEKPSVTSNSAFHGPEGRSPFPACSTKSGTAWQSSPSAVRSSGPLRGTPLGGNMLTDRFPPLMLGQSSRSAIGRTVDQQLWIKMASSLAAALFLSGYEAAADQTDKTAGVAGEQNIIIHMNEPVSGLLERTPSTFSADCLQPAKVCWYRFRKPFSSGNLPSVTVMDGVAPLIVLDDTAGMTIVIDQELGNEIRDISFSVRGLPDNTLHSA